MNHVHSELRRVPDQRATRPREVQTQSLKLSPADEAVRDFFRRGDRGQYDGGPADPAACNLERLPTADLPERAPIVRTPKQQARRLTLIRFEAVLLAGCVVFLVVAARLNSSSPSEPQVTSVGQRPASQSPPAITRPAAAAAAAVKVQSAAVAPTRATAIAPKPMPVAQVQAPRLAEAPQAKPIAQASTAAANTHAATQVRQEIPKPNAVVASVKPQRQPKAAPPAFRSEPAAPTRAAAPRLAVAAFPDD